MKRICLKCGEKFASEGNHHRVCDKCKIGKKVSERRYSFRTPPIHWWAEKRQHIYKSPPSHMTEAQLVKEFCRLVDKRAEEEWTPPRMWDYGDIR